MHSFPRLRPVNPADSRLVCDDEREPDQRLEGQLAEDAARLDEYLSGAAAGKVVALPTGPQSGPREAQTRLASQSG
jgi:hypothetical protein